MYYQAYSSQIRGSRPFAAYTACYSCLLPQNYCQKWRPKLDGGFEANRDESTCSYPEFALGTFVVGRFSSEYRENYIRRLEQAGIQAEDRKEEVRWLGKKVKWGEIEMNRFAEEVFRAIEALYRAREGVNR